MADAARKGRSRNKNSGKGQCKNGHKLAGDNLRVIKKSNGRIERQCRTCRRARWRAWWDRKKQNTRYQPDTVGAAQEAQG